MAIEVMNGQSLQPARLGLLRPQEGLQGRAPRHAGRSASLSLPLHALLLLLTTGAERLLAQQNSQRARPHQMFAAPAGGAPGGMMGMGPMGGMMGGMMGAGMGYPPPGPPGGPPPGMMMMMQPPPPPPLQMAAPGQGRPCSCRRPCSTPCWLAALPLPLT